MTFPKRTTLALLACVVGSGACVANEESWYIIQNQVPQPSGTGGLCMVTPDPTALHSENGILDVSIANSYILNPLYRNEMLSTANRTTGHAETRAMYVDGADIELHVGSPMGPLLNVGTDSSGAMIPTTYTVYSSTFIDAATTSGPGYATGTLEIVPATIGNAVAAHFCAPVPGSFTADCPVPHWPNYSSDVIVVIKPFGHTVAGLGVPGGTFVYDLTLCCHCLVQFQSGDIDPNTPGPNCSGNSGTVIPPCLIGQDEAFDCRNCSGANVQACQPRGFQAGMNACPTT